ncbi:MAG: hypothetical protein JEY96_16080 [Bacteroidales bacterium]|nr:hypothetical protein [Bacteroidales bacterium]
MKKIGSIILTAILTFAISTCYSQEYKHDVKQGNQVVIKNFSGGISIEETSGSQLIIESGRYEKKPERADGLKSLYGSGAEDNTNIGLEVKTDGNIVVIQAASKQAEDAHYTFKVPKGINVKIDYRSPYAGDDIKVKNFSSELEVSILNPGISLENVTGPVILSLTNGDVEIDFGTVNQNSPISINAINGIIDITLPANTPADISMSTINGEIFTNFDIDFEKKQKDGLSYIGGGQKIKGKINGGGVDIKLVTINDNIYLRKK